MLRNYYENYGIKFINKVNKHINSYGNLYEYKIN